MNGKNDIGDWVSGVVGQPLIMDIWMEIEPFYLIITTASPSN